MDLVSIQSPSMSDSSDDEHDIKKVSKSVTHELCTSDNITENLDDDEIRDIAYKVTEELKEDERSMEDWLDQLDEAYDLLSLKREEKNIPFRGAANIKFPMTATAVINYASRALPELLKNGKVCSYKVVGRDPMGLKRRKGERIAMHLNWQVLEKMPGWMHGRDKLLHDLALCGTMFIKTWYDPINGVNRSDLIRYDQLIVNMGVPSLEEAPRISQYIYMTANEIVEHIREGLYCDVNVKTLHMDIGDSEAIYHELVEQHRYLDLDLDGYAEPYIVTIHKASGKILRIVARYSEQDVIYNKKGYIKKIFPENYFTDYHFVPGNAGDFFSLGLGHLLFDLNKTVNTGLNQLINAGHLATLQGGFLGAGLRTRKQDMEVMPGEWRMLMSTNGSAIKDNIVPFNYKEPSQVLFALMQFLVEKADKLVSTSDNMTGNQNPTNVSPNTLAMLNQAGQITYNAIQRRLFRGFKKELKKLVALNARYLDVEEYMKLIDPSPEEMKEIMQTNKFGQQIFADYDLSTINVVPVVDTNEATPQESLSRTQFLIQSVPIFGPLGGINPGAIATEAYTSMGFDPAKIQMMAKADPPPDAPNPQMIKMQADMAFQQAQVKLEQQKLGIQGAQASAKIKEHEAKAAKTYSDAALTHGQFGLAQTQQILDKHTEQMDDAIQVHKINSDLTASAMQADSKAKAAGQPSPGGAASGAGSPDPSLKPSDVAPSGGPHNPGAPPIHPTSHLGVLAKKHSALAIHAEAVRRGWKHA